MSIFKAYDIRGIYGDNLLEKEAYMIGFYFAKYMNLKSIKVGHDVRLSSQSLTKFIIKGFLDANCEVTFLGMLSTPAFYFSLFKGVNSGVMITASHNPKEYNGFKIMYNMESFDSRNGLYKLEKIIEKDEENIGEKFDKFTLFEISLDVFLKENNVKINFIQKDYLNFLSDFYEKTLSHEEKAIIKNFNFGLDFSSGVSSFAVPELLKSKDLVFTALNDIPDGNFPSHSPDPLKAKDYLKQVNIKTGFTAVFDGDGDRVVFFDENATFVLPDYVIATFIDFFSTINNKFVCDLRVSRVIIDIAKEKGLDIKLMRVGRAFYLDFMRENSCIFGAELSGHMFFEKFNNFDNPDIALIYMLKIVAMELRKNHDFNFSDMIEKYKRYYKFEEMNLKVKNSDKVLETLEKEYRNEIVMRLDGFSFDFGSYWFNLRKSNTEELIRINFEGVNKAIVEKEMVNLREFIKNI